MKRKIYIAGPMTGLPENNYPAFFTMEKHLEELEAWEVVNPARNFDGQTGLPWEQYIREDIRVLIDCEAVVFLPGWSESRGATLEMAIAQALGLKIFYEAEIGTTKEESHA